MQYVQHSGNDTGARYGIAGLRNRIKLIRSGWYGEQIREIARFCYNAAPTNHLNAEWFKALMQTYGRNRRYTVLKICIRGGRRRIIDYLFLLILVLAGQV